MQLFLDCTMNIHWHASRIPPIKVSKDDANPAQCITSSMLMFGRARADRPVREQMSPVESREQAESYGI